MMTNSRYSKVLSLAGFMGSGKSTVGTLLAQRLGIDFIDLDTVIQEKTGSTIPEIFSRIGEYGFRAIERMTLEAVLSELVNKSTEGKYSAVLSLGGGTLTTPDCALIVKKFTKCIYLEASAETLAHNLSKAKDERPMLKGCVDEVALKEKVRSLLNERSSVYEKTASYRINIDQKLPEAIVEEILKTL